MPLITPRRAGLVEQAIDQLQATIVSGEWPVGGRIPPETELATALDVGRNTVREAVRALAHAGLLEVRQGDGTFVRATTELSGALRKLCGSELRDALEVRRVLEVDAARLAAVRRTADDLTALHNALAERNAAVRDQDVERAVHTDTAFHLVVVRSAHNDLLTELYRGVAEVVARSVATTMPAGLDKQDEISHDGLVEAIAAQDVERAAREAGDFLTRLLDEN
ncbi:FadR/GntR family transcriptional regulator [Pseudonocardia sp. MH-G8]|uniref:FadR/GntR family transcriptional regulator n=1 Tax=Pseudonocardia sp. MH-G8 TaxID=1854588 RepID=UPI000BA0E001|nr:FadR/GntR family transcriptional regulator [Pseudonocardia sp. MH-G8]OZM77304.1 GntR family transcriptional regulator [Pseudonocardia sp. MH-G8]